MVLLAFTAQRSTIRYILIYRMLGYTLTDKARDAVDKESIHIRLTGSARIPKYQQEMQKQTTGTAAHAT